MTAERWPLFLSIWKPYQASADLAAAIGKWTDLVARTNATTWVCTCYELIQQLQGELPRVAAFGSDGLPAISQAFSAEMLMPLLQHISAEFVLLGSRKQQEIHPFSIEELQEQIKQALAHRIRVIIAVEKQGVELEQLASLLQGVEPSYYKQLLFALHGVWSSYYHGSGLADRMSHSASSLLKRLNEEVGEDSFHPKQLLLALPKYSPSFAKMFERTRQLCGGYCVEPSVLRSESIQDLLSLLPKQTELPEPKPSDTLMEAFEQTDEVLSSRNSVEDLPSIFDEEQETADEESLETDLDE